VTGTSTLRRAALVVGLLALVFAPRLAAGSDRGAESARAVGAAVLAPTFWSDGISPARAVDDHDEQRTLVATVGFVGVLASLLILWLEVQPRRRVRSHLLPVTTRWRGPPVVTSPTSGNREEQRWQRQWSSRADRSIVARARRRLSYAPV
jgi:hypothetical protein